MALRGETLTCSSVPQLSPDLAENAKPCGEIADGQVEPSNQTTQPLLCITCRLLL